jgi:hypothetical protein
MELEGNAQIEGSWADRTVGLDGVRSDIAMMRTPDDHSRLELTKYHAPAAVSAAPENQPPNTLGLHRVMFAVNDIDDTVARLRAHSTELLGEVAPYEDSYRLCYLRGPAVPSVRRSNVSVNVTGACVTVTPLGFSESSPSKASSAPAYRCSSFILEFIPYRERLYIHRVLAIFQVAVLAADRVFAADFFHIMPAFIFGPLCDSNSALFPVQSDCRTVGFSVHALSYTRFPMMPAICFRYVGAAATITAPAPRSTNRYGEHQDRAAGFLRPTNAP